MAGNLHPEQFLSSTDDSTQHAPAAVPRIVKEEPISPQHFIIPLVQDTLQYISKCMPLLENYAKNSLPRDSEPSSISQRVKEIRQYLHHFPPDIHLVPLSPTTYGVTTVDAAELTPQGKTTRYIPTQLQGRQHSSRQSYLNDNIVNALLEIKEEVKEIEETCKNLLTEYFPEKEKERLLTAIILVTLVHEIAHVIHATFAAVHVAGRCQLQNSLAYDIDGKKFQMGEPGDCAENILSAGQGEFFAVYEVDGDYTSISHLVIGEGSEEIIVSGDDSALFDLIDGRWDPAPIFISPTAATTSSTATAASAGPSFKKKASLMGLNHESLLEATMVEDTNPTTSRPSVSPESPVTPCFKPLGGRWYMRNGVLAVR